MSRSWALPVAGLVILACSGCGDSRDSPKALAERADRVVADLERLKPRLAKAGTADADKLAEHLAGVREGLSTLPAATAPVTATAATEETPLAAEHIATLAVRCPDGGCWRVGFQLEASAWRVQLRGGGSTLDDVGPLAFGAAISAERARPVDYRTEWSYGGEAVITSQFRDQGQHLNLFGVRPIIRGAIGITDRLAITARPLLEVGQASVKLGSAPGATLDRADVYAGFGVRVGFRLLCERGDLTGEIGWRRSVFNGHAGSIDYRVDAVGPDLAMGWSWCY